MSRFRLVPVLVVLIAALAPSGSAQAHDATGTPSRSTGFYAYRWRTSTIVKWRVTPGYSSQDANARYMAQISARSWNDYQSGMDLTEYTPWSANFDPYACPQKWSNGSLAYMKNGVHYRNITKYAGIAPTCWIQFSGKSYKELHTVQVLLDSDLSQFGTGVAWNWSVGVPESHEMDAWSVLTHEFGHVSGSVKGGDGKGHFMSGRGDTWQDTLACPGGETWPDSESNATMCDSGLGTGMYHLWDLEAHDKQTVENAY